MASSTTGLVRLSGDLILPLCGHSAHCLEPKPSNVLQAGQPKLRLSCSSSFRSNISSVSAGV